VAGGGGGRPHEQRREKRERKKRERRKKGRAPAPVQVGGSHANQIGVIESRHLLWCDSIDTWCFTASCQSCHNRRRDSHIINIS
jgi:hypothetical protein